MLPASIILITVFETMRDTFIAEATEHERLGNTAMALSFRRLGEKLNKKIELINELDKAIDKH